LPNRTNTGAAAGYRRAEESRKGLDKLQFSPPSTSADRATPVNFAVKQLSRESLISGALRLDEMSRRFSVFRLWIS
jgi:hypothetical protein